MFKVAVLSKLVCDLMQYLYQNSRFLFIETDKMILKLLVENMNPKILNKNRVGGLTLPKLKFGVTIQ